MPWAAVIGAGGAIVGGLISGNASQSAANTQANAANLASQTQLQMQQNAMNQVAPWRNAGMGALNQYSQLMGLGPVNMNQPQNQMPAPMPMPGGGGAPIPDPSYGVTGGGPPGGGGGGTSGSVGGGPGSGDGSAGIGGDGSSGGGGDGGGSGDGGGASAEMVSRTKAIAEGRMSDGSGSMWIPTPGGGVNKAIPGGSNTSGGGPMWIPTPGGGVKKVIPGGTNPSSMVPAPRPVSTTGPMPGDTSASGGAGMGGMGGNPAQNIQQWMSQLPGYQFQMNQGTNAINNSAAARGMQLSGNTLQALDTFGQGLAGTTFNQWLDRLNNMSTQGANASTGNATNIMQTGAQIGSNMIGAGNALAAGQVGSANALNAGLSGAANNYMNYQLMQSMLGGGGGGGGGGTGDVVPGGLGSGMFDLFGGGNP